MTTATTTLTAVHRPAIARIGGLFVVAIILDLILLRPGLLSSI